MVVETIFKKIEFPLFSCVLLGSAMYYTLENIATTMNQQLNIEKSYFHLKFL